MLAERFDNIKKPPLTSGRFADVYRTMYKGQSVAAKTLKITPGDDLKKVHKVGGLLSCTIFRSAYVIFPALCEGGRKMETGSTREHPTLRWGYLDITTIFDGLGLDGEWEYHEFYCDHSKSESFQPCKWNIVVCIQQF